MLYRRLPCVFTCVLARLRVINRGYCSHCTWAWSNKTWHCPLDASLIYRYFRQWGILAQIFFFLEANPSHYMCGLAERMLSLHKLVHTAMPYPHCDTNHVPSASNQCIVGLRWHGIFKKKRKKVRSSKSVVFASLRLEKISKIEKEKVATSLVFYRFWPVLMYISVWGNCRVGKHKWRTLCWLSLHLHVPKMTSGVNCTNFIAWDPI